MVLFGLPRKEVWAMTPALFAACSRVVDRERTQLDYQFAWTRQILAEPNRDKKKRAKPFAIDDFLAFPSTTENAPKKEMSPEQQRLYVVNFLHPLFKARAEIEKKKANGNV